MKTKQQRHRFAATVAKNSTNREQQHTNNNIINKAAKSEIKAARSHTHTFTMATGSTKYIGSTWTATSFGASELYAKITLEISASSAQLAIVVVVVVYTVTSSDAIHWHCSLNALGFLSKSS